MSATGLVLVYSLNTTVFEDVAALVFDLFGGKGNGGEP